MVGDTITDAKRPTAEALPGFKEIKPQVFAGLYPVEANEYEALREALGPDVELYVDGNRGWTAAESAVAMRQMSLRK